MRLQSQPLRLQRDRAAPGEGVVERREPFAVEQLGSAGMIGVLGAGPAPALPDLRPRSPEYLFVSGALPEDEFPQDLEQSLPLLLGRDVTKRLPVFLATIPLSEFAPGGPPPREIGEQHVYVLGRVVHHLGEENGPGCRQRPPCPPQVERRRMAVADGLLPGRRPVDGVERQRHLNQLLRHHLAEVRTPRVIGFGTESFVPS